jgi:TatD DNase family protein
VLVDAHCHLGDTAFDADRAAVLARARAAGVGHIVVIGESLAAAERAVGLARSIPGLSATAGVHPHDARTWNDASERALRALLARPEIVAVGETGLDYHYDHSPREDQRRAFDAQLAIAAELELPVVIHARAADSDLAAMLRTWGPRVTGLILHSFSGGAELMDAGRSVGAYFSFSGMITFKSWHWLKPPGDEAWPADRLLVETDAPYLSPVPFRGQRNEPARVREIALELARVRGESITACEDQLAANARRVFGPRLDQTLEAV